MKLYELLAIQPGLTALIGSGGKTTLLYHLCSEVRKYGTVLLTTTTHIRRPEQYPFAQDEATARACLAEKGVVCAGTPAEDGKLTAPSFAGWQTLADFVLVEADGAHGMPLKAHLDYEPVIPPEAYNVICVVGVSGWGQPIVAAAHRPERFAELAGVGPTAKATAENSAKVVSAEGFAHRVFLNQTDTLTRFGGFQIKDFARGVEVPVVSGSLRQGAWQKVK